MKTVAEAIRDSSPETMVDLVMANPGHAARAKARTEQARRCYQTQAERRLEAVQAQRVEDLTAFQRKATRMVVEHNATTAALATAALFVGYILALI